MNLNNKREPEYGDLLDLVFNLSANESALYASLIGIALAQDLTITEQNALGNFLMLVAQELVTMSAKNALVETRRQKRTKARDTYELQDYH